MNPRPRRILITLLVLAVAATVVVVPLLVSPKQSTAPPATTSSDTAPDQGAVDEGQPSAALDNDESELDRPEENEIDAPTAPTASLADLRGVAPHGAPDDDHLPAALGSFDWRIDRMKIEFAPRGAGISRITFANHWETAGTRRQARRIQREIEAGTKTLDDLPAEARYVLATEQAQGESSLVPVLGVYGVIVNETNVLLFGRVWSEQAPGHFVTEIRDAEERAVARISRRFVLSPDGYDITLQQRVENLSADHSLSVKLVQYGPSNLRVDRSRYMDRRRFRFAYGPDPVQFPDLVRSDDNDLLFEHASLVKKRIMKAAQSTDLSPEARAELLTLWPNEASHTGGYALSWFTATNRYFALAAHPVLDANLVGSKFMTDVVEDIRIDSPNWRSVGKQRDRAIVFTYLFSPMHTVAPGGETSFDLGVYAGPLDRHILGAKQPYKALAMDGLILYQMSSCCAACTFQWLAKFLLSFLTLLHNYVVFDWALAIIGLVIVVRTLLHPITKKSQVSMQRFGKQMQAMKPDIDKLQKKYGHDPKRMQQEQLKLMRERGVSPLGCLGMLPMFLQTPIWIALYAMLYFVFDLRQEPAFFGIFQLFWDWPFLGDLSSADHFFFEFDEPKRLLFWNLTGINLLPLLMGAIFYVQQKYMSPPPSPTMTKEQLQQQKIMKVMMVVMFPVMLYSAPSGLTLYILTSSCIGIVESRYIRAHVTEMDLKPKTKKPGGKAKPKDAQGRAFAAAMDRAEEKRRQRKQGPPKRYKKKK